jgi:molybdopterin synthase catalytic subunit
MTDVQVRLFASLKERAGAERIRVPLAWPADVQSLLEAIAASHPSLGAALPTALVAVNMAFAERSAPIRPGDEIAIFPPVSGGSDGAEHPTYFALTHDQVDLNAIVARLTRPDVGAVVLFTGSVRGETQREGLPEATMHLEYEAYEEMARLKMDQIAAEIWQRWPLVKGVAIVQRTGRLEIGETTTLVACAAAHRDQGAFEAARYGIDRLKEIVPVWKREVGRDRSEWIEGHFRPTSADNL